MAPTSLLSSLPAAVSATTGLVAGGWGYYLYGRQREGEPRCSLAHAVEIRILPDGRAVLSLDVTATNAGKRLVHLVEMYIQIHQLAPLPGDLGGALTDRTAIRLNELPLLCHHQEVQSPVAELEPGEVEAWHHDFLIAAGIRSVTVYTFVRDRKEDLGWRRTTLHDVRVTAPGRVP